MTFHSSRNPRQRRGSPLAGGAGGRQVPRKRRWFKATASAPSEASLLDVAPGEFFVLLGPNGAGKTTTISILTTTLAPTAGQVLVAGYDVANQASAVRQFVGIIFQNPSLDVNLTAEENVRLHAILYGLYHFAPSFSLMPRAYQTQIHTLAEVLGIEKEIFKPIKTFSGGMKRNLEIIRSLIHRPRVLFLDEPTSGLDPASRRSLWEYLRQVRAEYQTTIFLTTHYLEEAEQADRICILNHGRVVANDTPAQVKATLIENYVLIDAVDRAALRAELERRNIQFTEIPQFKIDLDGVSAHQIFKMIDSPLTVVQVHTPTVEDAYLSILERE